MPHAQEKKQQQVALTTVAVEPTQEVVQPRQPTDLQGLLRYAMEADAAGHRNIGVQPLTEENKNFIQDALKSMTIDVVGHMKENILQLTDIAHITAEQVPDKLRAIDNLLEYVDQIDVAIDFQKLDGYAILEPCLRSPHAEIRMRVCDLIAEVAQNNPYVQTTLCETTQVMATLLRMLAEDECGDVRAKSVYAISSIARESAVGYAHLNAANGLSVMKSALEHENDKLRTKTAFMLTALWNMDNGLIDQMVEGEFLPTIFNGLNTPHRCSHEHLISLLNLMLENSPKARHEVRNKLKSTAKAVLEKNLSFIKGKDEFLEEEDNCTKLLKIIDK